MSSEGRLFAESVHRNAKSQIWACSTWHECSWCWLPVGSHCSNLQLEPTGQQAYVTGRCFVCLAANTAIAAPDAVARGNSRWCVCRHSANCWRCPCALLAVSCIIAHTLLLGLHLELMWCARLTASVLSRPRDKGASRVTKRRSLLSGTPECACCKCCAAFSLLRLTESSPWVLFNHAPESFVSSGGAA